MDFLCSLLGLGSIKKRSTRQNIYQSVAASYSMIGSYMVWKLICVLLNNDSPIVGVLSESMEPGFKRGDILFLRPREYRCGSILVYQITDNSIPIVHRVIKKEGDRMLTKGDNNSRDDVGLYKKGKTFLEPHEARSTVFGYIPFFGIISIWLTTYSSVKYLMMALSVWLVFSRREDERSLFLF